MPMPLQTDFDMKGFTRAVEAADWLRQLDHYAEDAQLEIVEAGPRPTPLGVVRGRAAITQCLRALSSRAVSFRLWDTSTDPGTLAYTQECRYSDGSRLVFTCSGAVEDGRISQAALTVVELPAQVA